LAAREFLAKAIENALLSQEIKPPDEVGQQFVDAVYQAQENFDISLRKIQDTLTDEIVKNLKGDHLITWLQNNNRNIDAQALTDHRLALYQTERGLENYCQSSTIFKHYISAFANTALWLDYQSALLYARQANINLYIWKKDKNNTCDLTLIDYHKHTDNADTAQNEIHLLFTDGFTHFNLLSKASVRQNASDEDTNENFRKISNNL